MSIYSNKFFKNPIEIIEAKDEEIKFAFDKIEELKKQYYLLGYINYDFNELYFEVYQDFEKFIPQKITKPFGTIITPLINKENYFEATRYHSLMVSDIKEPIELKAKTVDNIPMAIKVRNKKIYGVQFHPEAILTENGIKIFENFIKI